MPELTSDTTVSGGGTNPFFVVSLFLLFFSSVPDASDVPNRLAARVRLIDTYDRLPVDSIVSVVKSDLLSGTRLVQDAACIILLTTLDRVNRDFRDADTVFSCLSADAKVTCRAEEIISERIADWQITDDSDTAIDDFPLYVPLFRILGRASVKSARGVVAGSVLTLSNRKALFDVLPFDDQTISFSLKRLYSISAASCCAYPGKTCVIQRLDHSGRNNLLDYYSSVLSKQPEISPSATDLIEKFIVECLNFGGEQSGAVIRLKALSVTEKLKDAPTAELMAVISEVSSGDPYFIHEKDDATILSLTKVRYPVREAATGLLRHLK